VDWTSLFRAVSNGAKCISCFGLETTGYNRIRAHTSKAHYNLHSQPDGCGAHDSYGKEVSKEVFLSYHPILDLLK
jgi:hypothetical protein